MDASIKAKAIYIAIAVAIDPPCIYIAICKID